VYAPWQTDSYGAHLFPDGTFSNQRAFDLGPYFEKRGHFVPTLDEWHCFEFMVRANTVAKDGEPVRDGRVTVWKDGEIMMDYPNLVLRCNGDLTIDRIGFLFYANAAPADTLMWYDNIVVATEYVGPIKKTDGID
jgi:hypothetical protein